ncbi:leucine-rich repeat protein [Candidatus Methanarcanum hacksteinii]|uniref:leucine-rich repeat protein n=1 Tax=Candidatus Methanarcanum hacksteinii TaxID=2911857 RepID=UPI0037DCA410
MVLKNHRKSGLVFLTLAISFFLIGLVFTLTFYADSDATDSNGLYYNKEYFAESVGGDEFNYKVKLNTDGQNTITIIGSTYDKEYGNLTIPSVLIVNGSEYKVTQIGSYAFYAHGSSKTHIMGNLSIPNTVLSIGPHAFEGQYAVTSIIFDDESKLKEIGPCAFSRVGWYTGSATVTIPDSVTNIGSYAFSKLSAENTDTFNQMRNKSISIILGQNNNLEVIGNFAFCGQKGSIHLTEKIKEVGYAAFSSDMDVTIDSQNTQYKIENGGLYSKDGKSLISALYASLETMVVAEGTVNIGPYCFFEMNYDSGNRSNFVKINQLSLPSSIESIETYAFSHTNNGALDDLTISFGLLNSIHDYSFVESDVKEVIIPASVEYIGAYAFCDSLIQKVVVSNDSKLELISNSAFKNCKNLTVFELGTQADNNPGLTFGQYSFMRHVGDTNEPLDPLLLSFNENTKINAIEKYALCGSLICQFGPNEKEIILPSTLSTIGDGAFIGILGNRATVAEVIGEKINGIGSNTHIKKIIFRSNDQLSAIPFSCFAGIGVTGSAKSQGTLLQLDLSELTNLTSIGDYAFQYAGMDIGGEIKLPENVRTIGRGCFYEFVFTGDFTIPASVEEIGDYAFIGPSASSYEKINISSENGSKLLFVGNNVFGAITIVDLSNSTSLVSVGDLRNGFETYKFSKSIIEFGKIPLNPKIDVDYVSDYSTNLVISDDVILVIRTALNGPVSSFDIHSDYFKIDNTGNILFTETDGKKNIQKVLSTCENVDLTEYDSVMPFAFVGCQRITELTLPSNLKIYGNSFVGMDGLLSINVETLNVNTTRYLLDLGVAICIDGTDESAVDDNFYRLHKHGNKNVYLPTSISGLVPSYQFLEDGNLKISLKGGYDAPDLLVVDSANSIINPKDGKFSLTEGLIKIKLKDRNGSDVNIVTFDGNGGYLEPGITQMNVSIVKGLSITDFDMPKSLPRKDRCTFLGWSVDRINKYDFTSEVVENLTLYSLWSDESSKVKIYYETKDGVIISDVASGSEMNPGAKINLTISLDYGHENPVWICEQDGHITKQAGSSFTVNLEKDTYLRVMSTNVAQSGAGAAIPYIVSSGLPEANELDDVVKVAIIGGGVNNAASMMWKGQSSTPLVVGDYIYCRVGNSLMKIESDTGLIIKSVPSIEVSAFYYYITYGNGVIIDNNTFIAYDLNLNQLFVIPEIIPNTSYQNEINYYGGYFYFQYNGNLCRISASDDNPETDSEMKEIEICCSLSGWKLFGSPVGVSGYLYYAVTEGNSRGLMAFNTTTKESKVVILHAMSKQLLDDAWITYSGGKIYLTAYSMGLFGAKASQSFNQIACVEVNGLEFSSPTYTEVTLGGSGAMTNFVVFKDRGYLVTGSKLLVFDVDEMELIYSENSAFNHGGIVLDTSRATSNNGWEVSIYVIPYDLRGGIIVHTDNNTKTVATTPAWNTSIPSDKQYCSQAVRTGSDGQIIWMNDTGLVFIYTLPEKNNYYFFLENGDSAGWYSSTGSSVFDALNKMDDSLITMNDDVKIPTSILGSNGSFDIYMFKVGLNEGQLDKGKWVMVDNFIDSSNDVYHYYIITNRNDTIDGLWSYQNEDGISNYRFVSNIGDRSILNKALTRTTEIVVSGIPSNVSLAIGEEYTLNPVFSSAPESISWKSINESIATVSNGKITAVSTGTTTIVLTFDGNKFECLVNVTNGLFKIAYVFDTEDFKGKAMPDFDNMVQNYEYESGKKTYKINETPANGKKFIVVKGASFAVELQLMYDGDSTNSGRMPSVQSYSLLSKDSVLHGLEPKLRSEQIHNVAGRNHWFMTLSGTLDEIGTKTVIVNRLWTAKTSVGDQYLVFSTSIEIEVVEAIPNTMAIVNARIGEYTVGSPDDSIVAAKATEGYAFAGWYRTMDLTGNPIQPGDKIDVSTDTILYAKWVKVWTLSFEMNGHGAEINNQVILDGSKFKEPDIPSAPGYVFIGWYNESECTTEFDFDASVSADDTAYAKWEMIQLSVGATSLDVYTGKDVTVSLHLSSGSWNDVVISSGDSSVVRIDKSSLIQNGEFIIHGVSPGSVEITIYLRNATFISQKLMVTVSDEPASGQDEIKNYTFTISMEFDADKISGSSFTASDLINGITISAKGKNAGEALETALSDNGIPAHFYSGSMGGDGIYAGQQLMYWVDHIFGLGDYRYPDGNWKYWIQYHNGTYNSKTLGYYTDGGSFELIYGVTDVDGNRVYGIAPDNAFVYDGTTHMVSNGFEIISGDEATKDAGTYHSKLRLKSGYAWSDYTYSDKDITWTVSPKVLKATYEGESIDQGDAPSFKVIVTGFVAGDSPNTIQGYQAPTVVSTETAVGTYSLTPSGGNAGPNYVFEYEAGKLVINRVIISEDTNINEDGSTTTTITEKDPNSDGTITTEVTTKKDKDGNVSQTTTIETVRDKDGNVTGSTESITNFTKEENSSGILLDVEKTITTEKDSSGNIKGTTEKSESKNADGKTTERIEVIKDASGNETYSKTEQYVHGNTYIDNSGNNVTESSSKITEKDSEKITVIEESIKEIVSHDGQKETEAVKFETTTDPAGKTTSTKTIENIKEHADSTIKSISTETKAADGNESKEKKVEVESKDGNVKSIVEIPNGADKADIITTVKTDSNDGNNAVTKEQIEQAITIQGKVSDEIKDDVKDHSKVIQIESLAPDASLTVPKDAIKAASDANSSLRIVSEKGSIAASDTVLSNISMEKEITISISEAKDEHINDAQRENIPDSAVVVDVKIMAGDKDIGKSLGGLITISIRYTPADGKIGVAYYIDDDGNKVRMGGTYDPIKGEVVFDSTHCSLYMVVDEDPSKSGLSNAAIFVGIAVAVVAAIAVAIMLYVRKR